MKCRVLLILKSEEIWVQGLIAEISLQKTSMYVRVKIGNLENPV